HRSRLMPLICTCPQGHRWKHPGTPTPGTAAAAPPLCPTCGSAAANVNEDTGPDLHAETLTFTPGSHPLPESPVPPAPPPTLLPRPASGRLVPPLNPPRSPTPAHVLPSPAPRAPLPPAPGPVPGFHPAAPPRSATQPAESRNLPWLADRPRPEPPPRSSGRAA